MQKVLVENTGNIENTQKVTIPVSFWQSVFTKSDAGKVKIDGQRYLSWEITLAPKAETTLVATQNYRYPLYVLIVLIILGALYFYFKAPLSLSKTATSTKKDATLSELKITLNLKNVTKKPMKDIEIIDLVPGIADIEKSLELGTLKPLEIKHTKKGTLVKWKLAEIEAEENRLITYKVRSKLKILGALKLPRAKVIYGPKNKRKIAYSNTFKISSQA